MGIRHGSARPASAPAPAAAGGGGHGWRRALLVSGGALLIAGVLVAGIALGMSLHDNPRPTGPITVERTLDPLP